MFNWESFVHPKKFEDCRGRQLWENTHKPKLKLLYTTFPHFT